LDEISIRRRVEEARAGDADAFGALFEAFRPDVLRLCQRLLGHADAEDAAHEAFLRARRSLDQFDPQRPFRPWLLAIASHHAVDRLRRRDTERRIFAGEDVVPEALPGQGPSPLQGELSAALRRQVIAAVDALPDRYRAPVVLRYFAELPYETVAELLGVSKNQVATLLFRGRRHLRAALEDLVEDVR
jgi:RNA polymerase sigma-70 factor (ECF subfamily)